MVRPPRMTLRNAAIVLRERASELAGLPAIADIAQGHTDVATWLDQLAEEEVREETRASPPGDEQLEACRG